METRTITKLLQPGDANTKTRKNGPGFLSAGLSLAAHKTAGFGNVCPGASVGCARSCLDHQGLASVFRSIADARIAKTELWFRDRKTFLAILRRDLERLQNKASKLGMRTAVRLNMFSDIAWERYIIAEYPEIQFYDYTKVSRRVPAELENYYLTFSRSETNDSEAVDVLRSGHNVSVVFYERGPFTGNRSHLQRLPKTWHGFKVIDGDTTDLRFEDEQGRSRGRVVGLRLKTHSREEREGAIASGFAVEVR